MNDSDNAINDIEFTRQTYYDLINKGQNALDEMSSIASALEHPRAFEVVAGLIKTVSDTNDKLLDLHKKKLELSQANKHKQIEGNTTNNLFVGSTVELQRMLLDMDKNDNMIDVTDDNK